MRNLRKFLSIMLVMVMMTTLFAPVANMEEQTGDAVPTAAETVVPSQAATPEPAPASEAVPTPEPVMSPDATLTSEATPDPEAALSPEATPDPDAAVQSAAVAVSSLDDPDSETQIAAIRLTAAKPAPLTGNETKKASARATYIDLKLGDAGTINLSVANFNKIYADCLTLSFEKDGQSCEPTEAGEYKITLSCKQSEFEYKGTRYRIELLGQTTMQQTIEQCMIGLENAHSQTKTYDGTPLKAKEPEPTNANDEWAGYTFEGIFEGTTTITDVQRNSEGGVESVSYTLVGVKVTDKNGKDISSSFCLNTDSDMLTRKLRIEPRSVTVSGANVSKTYDGTPLYADCIVEGLPDGFTYSASYSGPMTEDGEVGVTDVGNDVFTVNGVTIYKDGVDVTSNFDVKYGSTTGTMEIAAGPVTAKVTGGEKTYDGTPLTADCSVDGLPDGFTFEAIYDGTPSITDVQRGAANAAESVGFTLTNVKIFKDGEDVTSYFNVTIDESSKSGTLKINPASVKVSVDDKSMDFGDAEPKLTATETGLVSGDTIAYTLERAEGDVPGTYAISAKGETEQGSYSVTYVPGTLTIYGLVTVEADDKTIDYGDGEPQLTATVTGLNEGDTIAYTLTRDKGNLPGTYAITPSGEAVQGYYRIQYVPGTLNIHYLNVTVAADNHVIDYGVADPELTATVSGLLEGDTIDYKVKREKGSKPGTYVVTPYGEATQGGYKITYETGKLQILYVPVTVMADNLTVSYGEEIELTASVTGLLGDDTIAYTLSHNGGENVGVGTYVITPAGEAIQGIYSITYEQGELTVATADVIVTADAKTKVYGDADPELTATVTGLVGDDTIAYTFNRADGENVGSYEIVVEGETTQGNYEIVYVNGEMEITPAPVVVTADAKTKVYGDADPELTAVVTGLKRGEKAEEKIAYALNRADGENVGSYEIVAEGETAQGNYEVSYVNAEMEITPAPVVVSADAKTKVYGDADPELTVTVTGMKFDEKFEDMIQMTLNRAEGENVGTYAIVPAGENAQGNYEITFETNEEGFEITPMPVVLTLEGGKPFGAKDPANSELAVLYAVDTAALADASKADALKKVLDAEAEGKNLPEWFGYDESAIHREAGEKLGAYDLMFGDAEAQTPVCGNYSVTFVTGKDSFVITSEDMPWSIVINDGQAFDTHTSSVSYKIVAKDEDAALIDNIHENLTIGYVVDGSAADADAPKVTLVNPAFEASGDDKTGIIRIPAMTYAKEGMEWKSYMPAGSKLVMTVQIAADGAETTTFTVESEAVVAPETVMAASVHAGEGMNVYPKDTPDTLSGGEAILLDENGYVQYVESVEEGGKAYIGEDDFIDVTFSYKGRSGRYVTTYGEYLKDGMNLAFIQSVLGAAEGDAWFGTNPEEKITVTCKPLDTTNHRCESVTFALGFDIGAENSAQEIGNRPEEVELKLTLKDTYQAAGSADSAFGGAAPSVTLKDGGMVWDNVSAWKNFPEALPKSGTNLNVTFKDNVGHDVVHTIGVVRSAATTGTSVYVKPMTDSTVPSGKLEFYGDANVWEELILTVGGRTFVVSPLTGDAVYDAKTKMWRQTVNLSDVDFPVGVPTAVSIAYADLNGEGSTIEITYKDEAQTPVLGGQPIVGGMLIWGYVEASASVLVDILHADGTTTPVPSSSVAVDQFGYFAARLDEELAEGDQIVLRTTDFCGNQKTVKMNVVAELDDNAYAELLGANIVGEVKDEALGLDSMEHRFATPVDLAALAADEDMTMELPILAYKSIEIGKAFIHLNEQGKLEISYSITASDYIPEGAQVRMSYAAEKPDAEALVLGVTDVAVENLFEALEGALPSIDVSGYADENGEYSGVVWLAAQFDIEMDEDSYVSRGGRGVNFYRWLTENLQTEELLNAIYSETYSYEENMAYYKLYQEFETLAK